MELIRPIVRVTGSASDTVSKACLVDEVYVSIEGVLGDAMLRLGAERDPSAPNAVVPTPTGFQGARVPARADADKLMSMFRFTNNPADVVHNSRLFKMVRGARLASLTRGRVRQLMEGGGARWSNNAVDSSGKRSRGYVNVAVNVAVEGSGGA